MKRKILVGIIFMAVLILAVYSSFGAAKSETSTGNLNTGNNQTDFDPYEGMNTLICAIPLRNTWLTTMWYEIDEHMESGKSKIILWKYQNTLQVIQINSNTDSLIIFLHGEEEEKEAMAGYMVWCAMAVGAEVNVYTGRLNWDILAELSGKDPNTVAFYIASNVDIDGLTDYTTIKRAAESEISEYLGQFTRPTGQKLKFERSWDMSDLHPDNQYQNVLNYAYSSMTALGMFEDSMERDGSPQTMPNGICVFSEADTSQVFIFRDNHTIAFSFPMSTENLELPLGWMLSELSLSGVSSEDLNVYEIAEENGNDGPYTAYKDGKDGRFYPEYLILDFLGVDYE